MKGPTRILACPLLGFLSACCSGVTVTKVTSDNDDCVEGFRYFLPRPFLQVRPTSDGTYETQVVYFPDLHQEYAVNPWTILGGYEFDMKRDEQGLLEVLSLTTTDTDISSQIAKSIGDVGTTAVQALVDAKKEEEEAESEARTLRARLIELDRKIAVEEANVERARALMVIAERRLSETAPDDPNYATIEAHAVEARFAYESAVISLAAYEAERDALLAQISGLQNDADIRSEGAPFRSLDTDEPHGDAGDLTFQEIDVEVRPVPGPMLFEIGFDDGGVSLTPISWVADGAVAQPTIASYGPLEPRIDKKKLEYIKQFPPAEVTPYGGVYRMSISYSQKLSSALQVVVHTPTKSVVIESKPGKDVSYFERRERTVEIRLQEKDFRGERVILEINDPLFLQPVNRPKFTLKEGPTSSPVPFEIKAVVPSNGVTSLTEFRGLKIILSRAPKPPFTIRVKGDDTSIVLLDGAQGEDRSSYRLTGSVVTILLSKTEIGAGTYSILIGEGSIEYSVDVELR